MVGRDLTSIKKIPSSQRPYDLGMFRSVIIFMACFIILNHMGGGYSQNVGLGLKYHLILCPYFWNSPTLGLYTWTLHIKREKKTWYIKIKDGNPSIKSTRQMRTQVNITQIRNKSKESIFQNQVKTLCEEESQPQNDNQ
jgi:hypothetical protein